MKCISLVDALKNKNDSNKRIIILLSKNQTKIIPYKELYKESLKVLGGLQKLGIQKGEELIFQIIDIEAFILTFWACLLGGIIPIPVTNAAGREEMRKLLNIWKQMNSPHVITKSKPISVKETYGINGITLDEINKKSFVYDELIKDSYGKEINVKGDDVAYVQYSSGSTGEPKGVILTHFNLLSNIEAMKIGINGNEKDSFLSWMPLTHDMGLIGMHLCPFVSEIGQILMAPMMFIKDPILWLKFIGEHRATVISSPNFGYKYTLDRMNTEKEYSLDLSSVRIIVNGAEPISYELCLKFINRMKTYGLEKYAMFPVYGMAEASLAISFSEINKKIKTVTIGRDKISIGNKIELCNEENAAVFVDVGYPVASIEVSIRNHEYRELPEDTVGLIFIRGDSVTSGYYNKKEISRKIISEDGWLNTGDIGFINEKRVVIIGREKDMVIINGVNYYCTDLERAAYMAIPDNIKAELAICGHEIGETFSEIILFIKYRGSKELFLEIKKNIKAIFQRETRLRINQIVEVPFFPKTTSGKIQRYELIKQYEIGKYNVDLS